MILRFIDKDTLVFKSVVLGCMLWDEDHDAVGTAEMMRKVVDRWDLTDADVDMATTDNASVMIASIREHFLDWTRLACTPHTLQLPLTRQLQGSYAAVPVARLEGGRRSETLEQQWKGAGPEKVHHLFKRVRVVTNFHTNRPNSKLQHILYNRAVANGEVEGERVGCFLKPAETRWTGLYLMGKALYKNHAYTLKFSYDNSGAADCCLALDDYQLLAQVLAVLEPFTAAMDIFQNTDDVSISLVYPELLQIVKALEDVEEEIERGGGVPRSVGAGAAQGPARRALLPLLQHAGTAPRGRCTSILSRTAPPRISTRATSARRRSSTRWRRTAAASSTTWPPRSSPSAPRTRQASFPGSWPATPRRRGSHERPSSTARGRRRGQRGGRRKACRPRVVVGIRRLRSARGIGGTRWPRPSSQATTPRVAAAWAGLEIGAGLGVGARGRS